MVKDLILAVEDSFGLGMCLSVAGGTRFLDTDGEIQANAVLFFQEESSYRNMALRVRALVKGHAYSQDTLENIKANLYCFTNQQFKLPQDTDEIIEVMLEKGIKLAVFDSLRRFHSGEENSSTAMQPILDSFSKIQRETEAALILIHHLHKESGEKKGSRSVFERMRGTSDFWAWRDCVIGLEKEGEDETKSRVVFQFRDAESPQGFTLAREIMPEGGIMLQRSTIEESDGFNDILERIEKYFEANPGPQFKSTILDSIRAKQNVKWRVFQHLIEAQKVQPEGKKWVWYSSL